MFTAICSATASNQTVLLFSRGRKKKANLLMYKGFEVIAEEPKEYSAAKLHC
jgi:hypothetical protein